MLGTRFSLAAILASAAISAQPQLVQVELLAARALRIVDTPELTPPSTVTWPLPQGPLALPYAGAAVYSRTGYPKDSTVELQVLPSSATRPALVTVRVALDLYGHGGPSSQSVGSTVDGTSNLASLPLRFTFAPALAPRGSETLTVRLEREHIFGDLHRPWTTIDLGADGSVELDDLADSDFHGLRTVTLAVDFDATRPFTIAANLRIEARGWGDIMAIYTEKVDVSYAADKQGSVWSYGSPCGCELHGEFLRAVEARPYLPPPPSGAITLKGSALPPNANAMLVLGVQEAAIQYPGSACSILAQPLVSVPLVADANGRVVYAVPLGATQLGGELRAQLLGLQTAPYPLLLASKGIAVRG